MAKTKSYLLKTIHASFENWVCLRSYLLIIFARSEYKDHNQKLASTVQIKRRKMDVLSKYKDLYTMGKRREVLSAKDNKGLNAVAPAKARLTIWRCVRLTHNVQYFQTEFLLCLCHNIDKFNCQQNIPMCSGVWPQLFAVFLCANFQCKGDLTSNTI